MFLRMSSSMADLSQFPLVLLLLPLILVADGFVRADPENDGVNDDMDYVIDGRHRPKLRGHSPHNVSSCTYVPFRGKSCPGSFWQKEASDASPPVAGARFKPALWGIMVAVGYRAFLP